MHNASALVGGGTADSPPALHLDAKQLKLDSICTCRAKIEFDRASRPATTSYGAAHSLACKGSHGGWAQMASQSMSLTDHSW